ncbi:hypothetical protein C1645_837323 [Glomus cerebriforme]|uniref:Uncharacterized protein n=1 Tax=Glomus cerebriforme TaxID=658196 RepID=A0A397S495_9GLOM|nr:hypothetical protein C1645_837323 [Glomus cerebriforme]
MLQKSLYIIYYIINSISTDSTRYLNDYFYLDVSVAFNTQNLPWIILSGANNIISPGINTIVLLHYSATFVKGGANNNTFRDWNRFDQNQFNQKLN